MPKDFRLTALLEKVKNIKLYVFSGRTAIDKSYWHLHAQERERLHPDDSDNPIWNDGSASVQNT